MLKLGVCFVAGGEMREQHQQRPDSSCAGMKLLRRRIPILAWLPQYSLSKLLQDALAGTTVGLTAIPQGIAYAVVAGLPPQVFTPSMYPCKRVCTHGCNLYDRP